MQVDQKLLKKFNNYNYCYQQYLSVIDDQEVFKNFPQPIQDEIQLQLLRIIVEQMLKNEHFKTKHEGTILSLLKKLKLQVIPTSEYLFKQGEVASDMYFIVQGKVQILKQLDNDKAIILTELGQGDIVGEMGILTTYHRRQACALAILPTFVAILKQQDFEEISQIYPEIYKMIYKIAKKRQMQNQENQNNLLVYPGEFFGKFQLTHQREGIYIIAKSMIKLATLKFHDYQVVSKCFPKWQNNIQNIMRGQQIQFQIPILKEVENQQIKILSPQNQNLKIQLPIQFSDQILQQFDQQIPIFINSDPSISNYSEQSESSDEIFFNTKHDYYSKKIKNLKQCAQKKKFMLGDFDLVSESGLILDPRKFETRENIKNYQQILKNKKLSHYNKQNSHKKILKLDKLNIDTNEQIKQDILQNKQYVELNPDNKNIPQFIESPKIENQTDIFTTNRLLNRQ
ncbi:Cyclic nucleotide-binding protein [Pseudocohnilembus persalinus]|uniref:Cyclic nucleotide-binding protein n=1 Tax=Pseudocohnilembus persalinus TaxID=266149 RepID=A0A0V0QQ68_PSEPJ|nr:Cyclic nucleotide-binding protein [Pseudocohnilembus persalinus]|eukprot:KRX04374.1 Cyclic nucleotide-binding protein [Pseudocohnilembus persalinus]